jgi:antitoxin (DNA-binding transcriptional repressor) of toxin-antitoxin stability system
VSKRVVIRASEAEAAREFLSLLARVRAWAEVVIERDAEAVAVVRPAAPHVRLLFESLRLAKSAARPRRSTTSSAATLKRWSVAANRSPRLRGMDSRFECRDCG